MRPSGPLEFAVIFSLLPQMGCSAPEASRGSDYQLGDSYGGDTNQRGDAGGGFVPAGDGSSESLAGSWAQRRVLVSTANQIFGNVTTTVTSLALVQLSDDDGGGVSQQSTTCHVAVDNKPSVGVESIIPRAYIDSLGTDQIPATYAGSDFHQPTFVDVQGVILDAPATDAMPSTPDDSRIYDQDDDGNPGMTVFLTGIVSGDIYVIQRNRTELVGTIAPGNDSISGTVIWQTEQLALGSDPSSLAEFAPGDATPVAERSVFTMVKVAAGTSCDDVTANPDGW